MLVESELSAPRAQTFEGSNRRRILLSFRSGCIVTSLIESRSTKPRTLSLMDMFHLHPKRIAVLRVSLPTIIPRDICDYTRTRARGMLIFLSILKKLKNVSCEYDRLNG